MIGLLILIIVIFAIRQHRRSRKLKWRDHYWSDDEFRRHFDDAERFASELPHRLASKIQRRASCSGSSWERKMADKFERQAARFESSMRRKFDRQTERWTRRAEDLTADSAEAPQTDGKTDEGLGIREGVQATAEAWRISGRASAAAERDFMSI